MPWIWVLEHRRDAAVVADHEGIQPPPRVLVVATDNVFFDGHGRAGALFHPRSAESPLCVAIPVRVNEFVTKARARRARAPGTVEEAADP